MTSHTLRDLRRCAGLTQPALARRVPCHWRTVQDWERGVIPLSPAARTLLLDVFDGVVAERRQVQKVLRQWRPA
jgi:DNA-binding transcriptional regulator YiaG